MFRRSLLTAVCAGFGVAVLDRSGSAEPVWPDTQAPRQGKGAKAPIQLPRGWTWVEGTGIPGVRAEPQLPTTVIDGTGARVTVADISRVIAGGDEVADVLAALGLADHLYAAPANSVVPAAKKAPVHFKFSQKTSAEGLLAVQGSLFIGSNRKRHASVAEQFRSAGVAAVVVDEKLPTPDKIRAIANYVGASDAGEQLARSVEQQLAQAKARAAGSSIQRRRILVVTASGAGGASAVVGSGTAAADIIAALGATSVGVDMGLTGYSVKFSAEGLLQANPDVVIMGDEDLLAWRGPQGLNAAFPTLASTNAGLGNHFIVMPSEQIKVSGVGVGAGALALALAKALASIGS